jgi:hypothetical protein
MPRLITHDDARDLSPCACSCEPRTATRARRILRESDTTLVRVILGLASLVYGGNLLAHVFFGWPPVMERAPYTLFRLLGDDLFWALAFILHGLGVLWRTLTRRSCVPCALAVNCYGFVLWGCTTAAMNYGVGFVSPASSLEWTMILFSGLALASTGLRDEIVTP